MFDFPNLLYKRLINNLNSHANSIFIVRGQLHRAICTLSKLFTRESELFDALGGFQLNYLFFPQYVSLRPFNFFLLFP